jgi:hypothetical protein
MYPSNVRVAGKRIPNNYSALKLLEEGYVIVQANDVPEGVIPFGHKPIPEPYSLKTPEPGDVSIYLGGNHKNYAHMIPEAPSDGRAYVRMNNEWVLLSEALRR